MSIYIFPAIIRKPATFDKDAVTRSLIAEEKYGVSYGYEYSSEVNYNISVAYQNINQDEYLILSSFYDDVTTIIPFIFTFEDNNYNVRFKDPIIFTQNLYNCKSVAITLETYTGDIDVI